jgi:hypothetical protein
VILTIDPGPEQSAFVLYDPGPRCLVGFGKVSNEKLRGELAPARATGDVLVVEMVASYGMPVGREVFETVLWTGRFIEAWGGAFEKLYRSSVKLHMCGQTRAKDANVRQAVLDAFGGKDKAVGKKAKPGPLYGVKADVWQALALALTYADRTEQARAA